MALVIEQLVSVTPAAREKIDGVRTFNDFPEAVLRVRVLAKEGPRFRYEIALEDPRERAEEDLVVDLDGLNVAIDPLSAADLAGATIDLDAAITGGALRIDNPNEGWQDPVARAVQEVIDRQINPGRGITWRDGDPGGGPRGDRLSAVRWRLPRLRRRGRHPQAGRGDGHSSRSSGHIGDRGRDGPRRRHEPVLPARALGQRQDNPTPRDPARGPTT